MLSHETEFSNKQNIVQVLVTLLYSQQMNVNSQETLNFTKWIIHARCRQLQQCRVIVTSDYITPNKCTSH
uniref:Uncharacterized protein n=1 Tax=Rhizophora mucronata TaxID=61149 RepID=A0A2P2MU11_RHIMU